MRLVDTETREQWATFSIGVTKKKHVACVVIQLKLVLPGVITPVQGK